MNSIESTEQALLWLASVGGRIELDQERIDDFHVLTTVRIFAPGFEGGRKLSHSRYGETPSLILERSLVELAGIAHRLSGVRVQT